MSKSDKRVKTIEALGHQAFRLPASIIKVPSLFSVKVVVKLEVVVKGSDVRERGGCGGDCLTDLPRL